MYTGKIFKANFILSLIVLFVIVGFSHNAYSQSFSDSGGGSWQYRMPITINSPIALNDFQISVTVDTATLISQGKMQASGADIRFASNNGLVELPYWIESGLNTPSTKMWVRVDSIAAGTTIIYLYYGNPAATSGGFYANNGGNTFEFFDDFEDNSINTILWRDATDVDGRLSLPQETGGSLKLYSENNAYKGIRTLKSLSGNLAIEYNTNVSWPTNESAQWTVGLFSPGVGYFSNQWSGYWSYSPVSNYTGQGCYYTTRQGSWLNKIEVDVGVVRYYNAGTLCETDQATIPSNYSIYLAAYGGWANSISFNIYDFRVRKYTVTQPIVNPGTEEPTIPKPIISPSSWSLMFGNVLVGSSESKDLVISNSGTLNLNISSINIFGTDSTQFSQNNNCGVINPAGSCAITVTFTPTNLGAKTAFIEIISDDPDSSIINISLSNSLYDRFSDSGGGNWPYRMPITINSSVVLNDFQISVTVDTATLISQGKMQASGADIRFASNNGLVELPYWIESGLNTPSTKMWVRVDSIAAGTTIIYLYYGNPKAISGGLYANNGSKTFEFFDDFEDKSINTLLWRDATDVDGRLNLPQETGGLLGFYSANDNYKGIRTLESISGNMIIEFNTNVSWPINESAQWRVGLFSPGMGYFSNQWSGYWSYNPVSYYTGQGCAYTTVQGSWLNKVEVDAGVVRYYNADTLCETDQATIPPNYSIFLAAYGGWANSINFNVYDFRVRKYAATPPIVIPTPDPFKFIDQTGVPLSTIIISNTITVSGISASVPISVSGGEYSINENPFTNTVGTVNNGDTVRVRQISSANESTTTDTILTIGGVSDTFSVTTINQQPDLIISTIATSTTAIIPGNTFSVSNTAKNQGNASAGSSVVEFHLSTNTVFGDGDDIVLTETRTISFLSAGDISLAETVLTVPSTTPLGDYYVCAMADSTSAVVELDESNNTNCTSSVIKVTRPDLSITKVSISETDVFPGETITVTNGETNAGLVSAGAHVVGFRLSKDTAWGGADDVIITETRSLASLGAGESSEDSTILTIPANTEPGTYYILPKADSAGTVVELNEDNNVLPSTTTITVHVPLPDLIVTAASTTTTAVVPGGSVIFADTVKNQGRVNAGAFTVGYRLSTNMIWGDSDDIAITEIRTVPSLGVGAVSSANTSMTIPITTPLGTYYILVMADSTGAVTEEDENNNTLNTAGTIEVTRPELSISALSFTGTIFNAGSAVTVSNTEINVGLVSAGAHVVVFRLSKDTVWGGTDDVVITETRSIASLAAGGISVDSTILTIPANTEAGTYYVLAKADSADEVTELDETNNVMASTTTITVPLPDLIMTAASTTATAILPGGSVIFADTVKNQGGSNAGAFTVGYRLSTNMIWGDSDDVTITETRAVTSLGVGAVNAVTNTSLTIPITTPLGTYYILVMADSTGAVTEEDENNNTLNTAGTIEVTRPELSISGLSFIGTTFTVGETVTVSNMEINAGLVSAGPHVVGFRLSKDTVWGGSDDVVITETRSIASLDAGGSSVGSTDLTIPAGTKPGMYYLLAKADSADEVTELDETNNVMESPRVTIRPPFPPGRPFIVPPR